MECDEKCGAGCGAEKKFKTDFADWECHSNHHMCVSQGEMAFF